MIKGITGNIRTGKSNELVNEFDSLTQKDLAFISIADNRVYIARKVKVARGIRNKDNPKADEVIIFGCRKDMIPNGLKSLVEPYLKFKTYFKNFITGEEHYEKN